MIQDGYGDELLLLEKERLLQIQVSERCSNPDIWDDLLNEARLTLWEVSRAHPQASPAYLHASTAKRVSGLLRRENWSGRPSHQGKPDPLLRAPLQAVEDPAFELVTQSADWVDSILLRYHEGQILQTISELPPNHRAYVILRFWGQWTAGEMEPVIGVKSTNQGRMWTQSIQPFLAAKLGHLQTV